MFPVALAIGAGLGLLKSELIDGPKEEKDRKLAAATQRFSPWTGLQAQPVKRSNAFESMLNYGALGNAVGGMGGASGAASGGEQVNPAAGGPWTPAPATSLAPEYYGQSPGSLFSADPNIGSSLNQVRSYEAPTWLDEALKNMHGGSA